MPDQDPLVAFLDQIHPLPEPIRGEFLAAWSPYEIGARQPITRAGTTEKWVYFVLDGVQYSFYEKEGKEHTIAFTYPPSFSGIPESFLSRTPSQYHLRSITKSRFLRLSRQQLDEFLDRSKEIERLMRLASEQILAGLSVRNYELMALSIEGRFRAFCSRSAHLLNKIPHRYIASYLGMDPTNFSRLVNSVKIDS